MKLFLKIIIAVILAALAFIFVARLLSPEDNWICENGQWTKHGNPSASIPTQTCE